MTNELDTPSWEPARLIPVSGMRNAEEQECRATSALLAVLASVGEFGLALAKPYGALKGRFNAYIETRFELDDGSTVRPDGLIRTVRGKRSWTALIEVKTGSNELNREQIEAYLDLAKEQGFDCVITISNQIAKIPGVHPVEVDKRKLRKVALYHMSWSRVLTEAVLQKSYRGVADSDQAWILGELIRYLEHPNAGAVDFRDMGEHWVDVRDAVKNGTLRHSDKKAVEIAGKWEELVSFAVLRLGRQLGTDVQEVLSAKERKDVSIRIANIVDTMATQGLMPGAIRIPNTVGDIALRADLRAQQIVVSVSIDAPKTGRTTTRINWLLRQLKLSAADVRLESWGMRSRSSMSDLLANVRKKQSLLIPSNNREIVSFTVSLIRPMGLKRFVGKRSFIDSVLDTIDDFYGDVVQHLQEWQPAAPKLQKGKAEEADPPAVKEAVATDSSAAQSESNQSVENNMDNAEGSLHSSGS
ncbi:MAG: stress response protein [Armatimonadetes bacterium]|nr:stress response protein [Armatimonadota bacterium]